jgi:hypothetical protein
MIKLDIFYTKNMSLWLDLTIILKTLPALITQVLDGRSAARSGGRAVAGNLRRNHPTKSESLLLSARSLETPLRYIYRR